MMQTKKGTNFISNNNNLSVNSFSFSLLYNNINKYKNETKNPYLVDPSQLKTCDPLHAYDVEQIEANSG